MDLGAGARDGVPARARWGQPAAASAAQSPPADRRGRGDGEPDRLRPQPPVSRRLGAELAHGRRPRRPGQLALADVHRPVGSPGQPPLRRPSAGLARGTHAADGRRGPAGSADLHRRYLNLPRTMTPGERDPAQPRRATRAARSRANRGHRPLTGGAGPT